MPTKRRVLIFLVVLSIMLFAKYVWGQDAAEQAVGWDPVSMGDESVGDLYLVTVGGPIVGLMAGLTRVCNRNLAAKSGKLYDRNLLRLGI